ncbi:nucleopolyhedrovirus P10 family protein [Streptomyces sp. NPDC048297]|uniref:nucleopolyhedrovirus P10 family protein n=1 Tax=Streptomyces sp. NPDC048297 TaxID=3365531 RepID=UPI003711E85C
MTSTSDRWAREVGQQLRLGRLLPLGGARDGVWIAEGAVRAVLGVAVVREVPDVRLGGLRITLADPEDVHEPVVPPPPSALPPGALRVTADFAATVAEPLPATAARLRAALSTTARHLGLRVTEVDLRVTDLLEAATAPPPTAVPAARPPRARRTTDPDESLAAGAALSVPGVTGLTGTLGGLGHAVHIERRHMGDGEHADGSGEAARLPRRHVRVEVATSTAHRAVEVARRVRAAVGDALDDHPTVAVLVTSVG